MFFFISSVIFIDCLSYSSLDFRFAIATLCMPLYTQRLFPIFYYPSFPGRLHVLCLLLWQWIGFRPMSFC